MKHRAYVQWIALAAACVCWGCEKKPADEVATPATKPVEAMQAAGGGSACNVPSEMPKVDVPADRSAAEDLAAAANARGSALMAAGRPIEALEAFRKVQLLLPDRVEGFVNEAIVHANDATCREDAWRMFEAIVQRDPNQPHALYGLAQLADTVLVDKPFETKLEYARRFVEQAPDDAWGHYLVGQALYELDRFDEALPEYARSIEIDPEFAPGHAAMEKILRRQIRERAELEAKLAEHSRIAERLRGMHKSVRFAGTAYTEQGPYAEVMELFGFGSTAQISASATPIAFRDITDEAGLGGATGALDGVAGLTWLDFDNDGDLDLFVPGGVSEGKAMPSRMYRNGQAARPLGEREPIRFFDVTEEVGPGDRAGMTAAVAADWDRDGDTDLFLAGPAGCEARTNGVNGYGDPPTQPVNGAWPGVSGQPGLEDFDHDGDEDLYLPGVTGGSGGAANAVFRNVSARAPDEATTTQPAHTFRDESEAWPIGIELAGAVGVLWTDFDRDVDTDAIVFGSFDPGIAVFENRREAGFAKADALDAFQRGHVVAATLGDVDNNGELDVIVTRGERPVMQILLNRDGRFTPDGRIAGVLPETWASAAGVAAGDFDNDGDLDLLVLAAETGESNPKLAVLVNDGLGAFSFDAERGSWPLPAPGRVVAPADVNLDGQLDAAVRTADGGVRLLVNTSDTRAESRTLRLLRSQETKSDNRWKFSCPVGAKVKVQVGRYAQLRRSATASGYYAQASPYVHLGLGKLPDSGTSAGGGVSGVEILWPSGAIQGLMALEPDLTGLVNVPVIDVRVASCPFLFAWDGSRYRFLGDVLAASPPGLYIAPGVYASCDTDEYIRIPEGLLGERDGAYDLVVHECLREITFLDQAALVAVDHPESLAVYPNERFSGPPPFPEFKLFAVERMIPPADAVDHRGVSCLNELESIDDGLNVQAFRHLDLPGFGERHAVEMVFEDVPAERELVLLLHGYLKFPGSPSQYVANERGLRFEMPRLERQRNDGTWETLIDNIGAPAGLPRTVTAELTGKLPAGRNRLRVATNILVYWDWARLGVVRSDAALRVQRLAPDAAELAYVGFPRMTPPVRRGEPEQWDYGDLALVEQPIEPELTYRWPNMTGRYTRFGEVAALLGEADDRYVIFKAGEQVRLRFRADRLDALPAGMTRTFLLCVDGWVKDNYHQTATSATVGPLPFHGMGDYPEPASEAFPWDDARRQWDDAYNTRAVPGVGAF